tara:strand:+ start:304 stop:855 length:552 start_codon:yes stop_codon:yes gene_type:complete
MSLINYLLSKSFLKTSFRITLTAVIFFIVLVLFLRLNTRHGDFILVPDLIGKNIEEFESELVELDLKYIISDSGNYNPEFKINSVLNQIPKANAKVKEGRKIYLTLNASDYKMVEIPRIKGTTVRQARKTIESIGFIFGKIEYVDYIARDEVISISHEGNNLNEGNYLKRTSVIDFKLGNGKQ